MSLPPYSSNVYWKEYEITTPTFKLTPVEKPDMSPFLIHMTGKNQLAEILKGNGADDAIKVKSGQGYLKSVSPEVAKNNQSFNPKVVCFTESPTFSLDFFRYRKFDRWQSDQRFGIGFEKAALVEQGVRPVIYTDEALTKKIIEFWHRFQSNQNLCKKKIINNKLKKIIDEIYPLLFPLLEKHSNQGFMWEREWRSPNPDGLVFNHTDIRIICCPQSEEKKIKGILKNASENIEFIRTWKQYDDITCYLNRQSDLWQLQIDPGLSKEQRIKKLKFLVEQYKVRINSLDSYKEVVEQLLSSVEKIDEEKNTIKQSINKFEEELYQLKNQDDEHGDHPS
ncbi:hypothetical protein [Sphaerothrix gracilis]|uniref:hypothetical protein n=1 Tax=Sphaerothrix gracilis TaxID=3151835 RepID=UPI0031FCC5B0